MFDIKSKFLKILKLSLNKGGLLVYGVSSLILLSSISLLSDIFENDKEIQRISMYIGFEELIRSEISKNKPNYLLPINYKEFRLSQDGWDNIRYDEGDPVNKCQPVLKAYEIGGNVTIGWGHSNTSGGLKFNIGDSISKKEAQSLLKDDLKVSADGVRRILSEWSDFDIKISQDMFDVLVSIAFNSGIGSLRSSDIIMHLKNADYEKAGESIKTFKVSDKLPGLKSRRENEYKKFISYKSKS